MHRYALAGELIDRSGGPSALDDSYVNDNINDMISC